MPKDYTDTMMARHYEDREERPAASCPRIKTKTTKEFKLVLTKQQLIDALQAAGHRVPVDAHIYVNVPGGGDWSNQPLDLDETNQPLNITWSEVKNED
jgi:hypothetical protein